MFDHAGTSGVTRATATVVQGMLVLRERIFLFVTFEGVRRTITAPLPLYTAATAEDGTHPSQSSCEKRAGRCISGSRMV